MTSAACRPTERVAGPVCRGSVHVGGRVLRGEGIVRPIGALVVRAGGAVCFGAAMLAAEDDT